MGKVLGSRQTAILEYLWKHGSQSVSQLHRGMTAHERLAYTTVFTELSRMLKKGLVAKSNEGGSHLDMRYRAALTREEVVSSVVSQTLGGLISAHGSAALHGFLDAVSGDSDAFAELRLLVDLRTRNKR